MKENTSYRAGYEAMAKAIADCGWEAACDEFNRVNPPGQKWTGSTEGLAYAQGEYQALCDKMDRRVA